MAWRIVVQENATRATAAWWWRRRPRNDESGIVVGVGNAGDTDHQAPLAGLFETPLPSAAFTVAEGACDSLPVICVGSAFLTTYENGILREGWVQSLVQSIGSSEPLRISWVSCFSLENAPPRRTVATNFSRVRRCSPPFNPCLSKAALVRLLRGRAEDNWYCVESESSFFEGLPALACPRPAHLPNWVDLLSDTFMCFPGNPHATHAAEQWGVRSMKSCFCPAGMYVDPVLREGQLAYSRFVSDLLHAGSMKVTLSQVVESGVFFVLKKESSLRPIWDARKANRYVRRPLVPLMVIDEGLSNIEVDPTESGHRWFMTSVHFRNAFYCVPISSSFGRYISLPSLSGKRRRDFLVVASKQKRLFPCELVLPFLAGACVFVWTRRFALLQNQASCVASKSFQIEVV